MLMGACQPPSMSSWSVFEVGIALIVLLIVSILSKLSMGGVDLNGFN